MTHVSHTYTHNQVVTGTKVIHLLGPKVSEKISASILLGHQHDKWRHACWFMTNCESN